MGHLPSSNNYRSMLTTVVQWSHIFHVTCNMASKVYVDWLLGQSSGWWRSSKQGPLFVVRKGVLSHQPWKLLVIFDRGYIRYYFMYIFVRPWEYDFDYMILLYPDVVTQNGGIDANIFSSSVAAFIQRLADSFNSDPQQDKQEYYMRTVVNKLTAFIPWLSCKSVMFIFLSPQKWECWCNQFHIPAGPLVAVSNMFLLLSLFEKGIQLLLLRLAQKISLRWVKLE